MREGYCIVVVLKFSLWGFLGLRKIKNMSFGAIQMCVGCVWSCCTKLIYNSCAVWWICIIIILYKTCASHSHGFIYYFLPFSFLLLCILTIGFSVCVYVKPITIFQPFSSHFNAVFGVFAFIGLWILRIFPVGLSNKCYTEHKKEWSTSEGDFQPKGLMGKLL